MVRIALNIDDRLSFIEILVRVKKKKKWLRSRRGQNHFVPVLKLWKKGKI